MKEMAVTVDKHDESRPNEYRIMPLETYDEIRKVIYDFDEVFNPALSDGITDLDAYADKLYRNALVYVACDEAILGFVAFYANDAISHTAYLTQIAVKPEAQGRKVGIKLLIMCIEIAKRNTMTELKLEVHNHNSAAISLYEKNGFEFCGVASRNSMYMKKNIVGEYNETYKSNPFINAGF